MRREPTNAGFVQGRAPASEPILHGGFREGTPPGWRAAAKNPAPRRKVSNERVVTHEDIGRVGVGTDGDFRAEELSNLVNR